MIFLSICLSATNVTSSASTDFSFDLLYLIYIFVKKQDQSNDEISKRHFVIYSSHCHQTRTVS